MHIAPVQAISAHLTKWTPAFVTTVAIFTYFFPNAFLTGQRKRCKFFFRKFYSFLSFCFFFDVYTVYKIYIALRHETHAFLIHDCFYYTYVFDSFLLKFVILMHDGIKCSVYNQMYVSFNFVLK